MKENTKRYLKLSLILYIVILSVALVGTLAWFVFKQSATISTEENSKIVAGEYLEISLDDKNDETPDEWVTLLGVNNISQYPDVSYNPVTNKFWYPVSLDEGEQLFVGNDSVGVYNDVTNTADGYFMKIDLKVRASKGLDVYLHNNSFVSGIDMDKTDANNSFSKDAIAGAARVAFFDGSGALKTVWVPNEHYQLEIDESTGTVTGFTDTGRAEDDYYYLQFDESGKVVEGNEYGVWDGDLLSVGGNALASTENGKHYVNDATPILHFDEAGEQNLTVYIWIEGSDREANTVLSGGSIEYALTFIGIPEKAEPKIDIESLSYGANGLTYADGKIAGSEILYSLDGENWTCYGVGSPLVANAEVFYIRTAETATEKASTIKEIRVS